MKCYTFFASLFTFALCGSAAAQTNAAQWKMVTIPAKSGIKLKGEYHGAPGPYTVDVHTSENVHWTIFHFPYDPQLLEPEYQYKVIVVPVPDRQTGGTSYVNERRYVPTGAYRLHAAFSCAMRDISYKTHFDPMGKPLSVERVSDCAKQ
jgi:hypothetical protein